VAASCKDVAVDTSELAEPTEHDQEINLVPDQGESELDATPPIEGFVASVSGTDWTVETLVNQMRKGRIDLDPSFQRRNAWLDNRKSKLIESILLGFPIPQIVLAEKAGSRGQYFVLDGKQRLLALRQYFAEPDEERDATFSHLKLSGLEVLTELNGTTVRELEATRPDSFSALENSTVRTVVLSNWNSEALLLSLFLRLNTGSVALSPQELRQALIPGPFMQWIDRESGRAKPLQELLGIEHPDRRMVDAELLLRHTAFTSSPLEYRGNLKSFLDDTSRLMTSEWQQREPKLGVALDDFTAGLQAGRDAMGGRFCRKWTGTGSAPGEGKWERALNRAVFDVQAYSLSIPEVRAAFSEHIDDIIHGFQHLCVTDESFVRSISATTKTADAFLSLVTERGDLCLHRPRAPRTTSLRPCVVTEHPLLTQLREMETTLLAGVSTVPPDPLRSEERTLTRAYLVLAHAVLEEEVEQIFLNHFDSVRQLLATVDYAPLELLPFFAAVHEWNTAVQLPTYAKRNYMGYITSPKASEYVSSEVRENHGLKADNVMGLAKLVGIEWTVIDDAPGVELTALTTLGVKRGAAGHTSLFSGRNQALAGQEYPVNVREWVENAAKTVIELERVVKSLSTEPAEAVVASKVGVMRQRSRRPKIRASRIAGFTRS
jgi:hypothetical protein